MGPNLPQLTPPGASRQAAMIFKSYRHSPKDTAHQRGLEGRPGRTNVSGPSSHATTDCFLAVVKGMSTCNALHVSPYASMRWEVALESAAASTVAWPLHSFFLFLFFFSFLIWEKAPATSVEMDGRAGESETLCNANEPSPFKWEEKQEFPGDVWLFTSFGNGSEILRRRV